MAKLTLNDVDSLANTASAKQTINDNSTAIETAVENTLSRDGTAPNAMSADLDMGGNQILNVADPVADTDAVNKRSVGDLVEEFASEIAETIIEATHRVERFVATSGQQDFPLLESPGTTANMIVSDNGLLLTPDIDYTLVGTDLTTAHFTVGRSLGAEVVIRYQQLSPADSVLRGDLNNTVYGASLVAYTPPAGVLGTVESFLDGLYTDGADFIGFTQDGAGAVARTAQEARRDYVSGEDFGVVGDGVTDDLAALGNALTRAVARGVPLVLDGTKSYGLSNQWTIPANARIRTNGATFVDLLGAGTGNTLLIDVGDGARIDSLIVTIGSGLNRQRCIRATGDCDIGEIKVTYTDQQIGDDLTDAAVRFTNGTRLRADSIEVTNHDRSLTIQSYSDVNIGGLQLTSYVRGLYMLDVVDFKIGKSRILVASPNAAITAGHCGVLMESSATDATRNGTLEDFNIEGAGEHGIRISGPEQLSNIYIVRPRIKGVGASGIKILGTDTGTPTSRNKRIVIESPIIEDVGTANSNRCGILAQFCDDVVISKPIIRKQSGANSAHTGIRLTSCTNVHIVHPHVMDAVNFGIHLDGSEGDIDQVLVTGGMVRANGDIGFRANTQTSTFRRIHVSNLLCSSNTNFGASFGATGGTALDCEMKLQIAGSTSAIACDSASVFLDGSGALGVAPLSGVTARNGSRWSDGVTLNIRKAGAWTAL